MEKISTLFFLFYFIGMAMSPVHAQDVSALPAPVVTPTVISADGGDDSDEADAEAAQQDKDDDKKAIDRINEVIKKLYDNIIAAKPRYKELSGFDEKCLTKDQNGFLTLKYETQVASSRGESFPYVFQLAVEPLRPENSPKKVLKEGEFVYTLPFLELQFSGYVIKHPIRRQFDFNSAFEGAAEDLIDYQQQFLPLRFMIIPEKKTFKTNQLIRFKVVLLNSSEHNILVRGLGKDTLFFTLNNAVWGTDAGEVQILSPREQRRQEREKRAEMRALLRKKQKVEKTILGPRTHVGDQIILREGEALVIDFVGEGYRRAQDVDLRGIYRMNVKGLRPTAKVKLKIVKDHPSS